MSSPIHPINEMSDKSTSTERIITIDWLHNLSIQMKSFLEVGWCNRFSLACLPVYGIILSCITVGCETCPDPISYGPVGCYSAGQSAVSEYGTGIGSTLYSAYYDQKMREEIYIQANFYNSIPAYVYILNEGGIEHRNAYATPDGFIYFGVDMFYYTVATSGELAVAGVLAHEWGHRVQFTFGWPRQIPGNELEADFFSGFYMALAKQWSWEQIQGYFANTYALGDYDYNNLQHHGTPAQRLASVYLGINTAIYAMQNSYRFTYIELHQVFYGSFGYPILKITDDRTGVVTDSSKAILDVLSELRKLEIDEILHGTTTGHEIDYPRKMSEFDVTTLRPHIE